MSVQIRFSKTALAIAVAILPSTSFAQAVLEEIVVTAQKREQRLEDVPISLDVLGAQELGARAISDTQDLALASPSLNFQSGFGPTSYNIAIRGIGTMALEGGIQPSISFVVDGVPLSRVAEFIADLGDVERVEILRGPQGTLYGRNSTGGAINLVRALPADEFEGYAEQTLTDDDEATTRLMVTGPLSDTVRGRLSGFYKDRDPHVKNIFPGASDLGGEETKALLGKLDIDISDSVNLLLTADWRDTKTGEGFQVMRAVETDPTNGGIPTITQLGQSRILAMGNGDAALGNRILNDPFVANMSHPTVTNIENYGLAADFTVALSDDLTLKSITSVRSFDSDTIVDVDVGPATGVSNPFMQPAVGLISSNYAKQSGPPVKNNQDDFTQEFRLEGSRDRLDWIAGLFYAQHEEETISEIPVLARSAAIPGGVGVSFDPRDGSAEWTTAAAFADGTFQLTDAVNLFAGLRWTVEDMDVKVDRQSYLAPLAFGGVQSITADFTTITTTPVLIPVAPGVMLPQVIPTANVVFDRSDRSEDWSGRIGMGWDVTDKTNAYISASKGYVGAGANYSRTSRFDNSVIDPSVTYAYEIGFKSRLLDDRMSVNAALFTQEVQDLQVSALIPPSIQSETFNAGNLDTRGLELNVTWAATDLLTLDASAVWLDTEIKDLLQPCYSFQPTAAGCNINVDNNPASGNLQGFDQQDVSGNSMIMAPDLSYNLSARLDLPLDTMPFDAYVMAVYSWQDEFNYNLNYDPLTEQDSYGLVDVFIGIEDKEGRYQVTLFGKNVGDEYYDSMLSAAFGNQARLLGRTPRGAQAYYGLKARFNF
jgi:iron complex outermembrane receptor protein